MAFTFVMLIIGMFCNFVVAPDNLFERVGNFIRSRLRPPMVMARVARAASASQGISNVRLKEQQQREEERAERGGKGAGNTPRAEWGPFPRERYAAEAASMPLEHLQRYRR